MFAWFIGETPFSLHPIGRTSSSNPCLVQELPAKAEAVRLLKMSHTAKKGGPYGFEIYFAALSSDPHLFGFSSEP